jgi:hypothetical protein
MNLLLLQIRRMSDLLMIPKPMLRVHVAEAVTATEIAVVDEVVGVTATKNDKKTRARLPHLFPTIDLQTILMPDLIQLRQNVLADLVVAEMIVAPRVVVADEADEGPSVPTDLNRRIVPMAIRIDKNKISMIVENLSRSSVKRMKRRNSSFLNSSITSWVQWAS